ncbi:hypothetical protein PI23P_09125 [Polaribacter irgensii 23-P]|uniref:DUF1573 domain-containing protein n=1 Tax=Polaribacter irgensii 23-P TaxID=313594 RepID=A4C034_9FLAO|nr:DUF1573 domain-containing protein [Polaribacter irgensii]EAR12777.1 hypothetical protein PI23P_09125 [Polaribacter irgensii 23-P]
MKTFKLFLAVLLISISFNAQEFQFETETIDYGKVEKASNGERTFVFTNIGDQPLIIDQIKSSCGCTVPKKPEAPIMPGEKGEIKVSYDTKRVGGFSKSITITSNAKNKIKIVKIKGFVNAAISLEKEKSIVSDY